MKQPTFSAKELLAIFATAMVLLWLVIPSENLQPQTIPDPPYRYNAPDGDNPALDTYSYDAQNDQLE